MINILDKSKCSGCTACRSVCPVSAITMVKDNEGFEYPLADPNVCIQCGLCNRVCPFENPSGNYDVIDSFGTMSNNLEERLASSSGGVFSLFAANVISHGGIVYGVAMSEDCEDAVFIRVDDLKDISRLRGSKYMQAHVGDTFINVKSDLEKGQIVLFSGTPCQVNGVTAFLDLRKVDRSNLICCDTVCHGVPSPEVWHKYKNYIEKKYIKKISSVNFREKDTGWKRFGISYTDSEKSYKYIPLDKSTYLQFFLKNLCLRESCYHCEAKTSRSSDVTIADFWGIEKLYPELNDDCGISLLIVRTEIGKRLADSIIEKAIFKKVDLEKAVRYNSAERFSCKRPDARNGFFEYFLAHSYEASTIKYLGKYFAKLEIKSIIHYDKLKSLLRKRGG